MAEEPRVIRVKPPAGLQLLPSKGLALLEPLHPLVPEGDEPSQVSRRLLCLTRPSRLLHRVADLLSSKEPPPPALPVLAGSRRLGPVPGHRCPRRRPSAPPVKSSASASLA
nr:uncharacterized protein LOC120969499 [Aegilops tauschii subsp. strangulata]